jgi:branched-chain amino acid aminotransferase
MSMADRDGWIWHDGKLRPWRDATTHVLTHTLHYGMGVFEGVRAYKTMAGSAIFRLREHTDRLFRSAHITGMKIPYDQPTLLEAQREVVRANKLEACYIRPIAFYGSEAMGINTANCSVHVAIAAWPWGAYLGPEALKSVGTYMNSILANQEAHQDGYDEALLLDVDGFVAEGSGENIFIVRNGKLYEPELTSALEGITRDSIITLAHEAGMEVIAKRITRDEVYSADEAFFTGTAAEVTPIRELDNRTIGIGHRGPVTEKLQKMFFDCVNGLAERHRDWNTSVTA